jgi:hypothetical protein
VATAGPARPVITACRAKPSTVYGAEAVTFELEATVPGRVAVELVDQRGQSVARALTAAPGEWQPQDLPSGDFALQSGSNQPPCWVTVNRELSRATEAPR